MKKNCISTLIKGGWICGCIICMASCGPVHRFMRIKNVPREYMRNYSIEGVKAPRSQTLPKHTPWIVFANEAGTSYLSPSGKNEMQSVNNMTHFSSSSEKEKLAQSHSIRPSHSEKRETERMETGKNTADGSTKTTCC